MKNSITLEQQKLQLDRQDLAERAQTLTSHGSTEAPFKIFDTQTSVVTTLNLECRDQNLLLGDFYLLPLGFMANSFSNSSLPEETHLCRQTYFK